MSGTLTILTTAGLAIGAALLFARAAGILTRIRFNCWSIHPRHGRVGIGWRHKRGSAGELYPFAFEACPGKLYLEIHLAIVAFAVILVGTTPAE